MCHTTLQNIDVMQPTSSEHLLMALTSILAQAEAQAKAGGAGGGGGAGQGVRGPGPARARPLGLLVLDSVAALVRLQFGGSSKVRGCTRQEQGVFYAPGGVLHMRCAALSCAVLRYAAS